MENSMWVKPVLEDNWGYKKVFLAKPFRAWDDFDLPEVKAGEYRVRWPDGHEETLNVVMVRYTEPVYDHGGEYKVSGHLPYIVFQHHGAEIKIPLHMAGIRVWKE